MILIQNISKQFGDKELFKKFSYRLDEGKRIALVGSNGAGKSTLMKIISGDTEPDTGKITYTRFSTVGYLPQDGIYHHGLTLYEEAETAFQYLKQLHKRIHTLNEQIAHLTAHHETSSTEFEQYIKELGDTQNILESKEGYSTDTKIKQILFGLGFTETDLNRKTEAFSGGWHMRIELAKLLLREPSVLLLDEPTNHLDMESLQWLETYLKSYPASIMLISHDSRFLDNIVETVFEISHGSIHEYSGNFSSFLNQRKQRQEILQATYENQQQLIAKNSQFIERFRYKATKARQVQSRIKQLEKLDIVHIEKKEQSIHFDFPEPMRSGRIVMELSNITKAYTQSPVLKNVSLTIERGDRIALLGVNGSGKSTLARIIGGTELIQQGKRIPGHNVQVSYYAQNTAESLDPDKTVLQTVEINSQDAVSRNLRTLLGCFLFSGNDVYKPVSVLSGGEKSRLALAVMLLQPANLIILDEPTNHLDMQSKEVLQKSLERFTGTYIIVSHDRSFLAPLINKVIVTHNETISIHHGSVDDYLVKANKNALHASISKSALTCRSSALKEKDKKRLEAEQRQIRYKRLKPLKNALIDIEEKISSLEGRKSEIEKAFADQKTYENESIVKNLHIEHDNITSQLHTLYSEWEHIEGNIEEAEASW